ncbi:MAG TPA: YciI family protein [Candidatus Acidoferrales bacterium]
MKKMQPQRTGQRMFSTRERRISVGRLLMIVSVAGVVCLTGMADRGLVASPSPSTYYVVFLRLGPNYLSGRPPQEQSGFAEHAANMSRLAREGTLVIGGPLLEESNGAGITGAMLVLAADSEARARSIVEADPLVAGKVTEIGEIRRFVVGAASWKPPQACGSAGDDSSKRQPTK